MGSLVPTTEVNCIDDESFTSTVSNRKNKRLVKSCKFVRNNPSKRVCKRGKKAKMFREACPASCKLSLCTCKDNKYVVFAAGERKFKKRCKRTKISLCNKYEKVKNSCPRRC